MKVKFALPIIKSKISKVLQIIGKNKSHYDYFEVWLDYIEDLNVRFVKSLEHRLSDKLLLLFRRQGLEPSKMAWKSRINIIKTLANSKVLFDFDIFSQKEELAFIKKNNVKIRKILSYHNYKETPSDKFLENIISKMEKYNPDIYKVSAFCNIEEDSIRLLNLALALKKRGFPFIVLGMGKMGIIARISGVLLGNHMNFAPQTLTQKSAPGQLTRSDLETIANIVLSKKS